MDLYNLFLVLHVIGTVLGVGGATYADIYFLKNMKRGVGRIDTGDALKTAVLLIHIGLAVLLISGFCLIVLWRITGQEAALYSPSFLSKMTIVLIVLFNGLLLAAKKIPIAVAGPISTVSWYSALVLGVWRGLDVSYYIIIGLYLVAVFGAILTFKIIRGIIGVNL